MKKLTRIFLYISILVSTQQLLSMQAIEARFSDTELKILDLEDKQQNTAFCYDESIVCNPSLPLNVALKKFDREQQNKFKKTGLIWAASKNWAGIVQALLMMRKNPNEEATNHKRCTTPLIVACECGALESAMILLAYGATLTQGNRLDFSPLKSAQHCNNVSAQKLIEWWIDVFDTYTRKSITQYQTWLKNGDNRDLLEFWIKQNWLTADFISPLIDWWQNIQESADPVDYASFHTWMKHPGNLEQLTAWLMTENHKQEEYPIPCEKYLSEINGRRYLTWHAVINNSLESSGSK